MAKDGQRPRIRLVLSDEWAPLPAWYPELAQAWQAARAAGVRWLNPDQFLQALWQTKRSPVRLRGRWDWIHAEPVELNWPVSERSPRACHIDSRGGRIRVYNPATGRDDSGSRVVLDVEIRLQPDAAEAPRPPPEPPLPAKSPRKTKAENDAADDAILDRLIGEKQMQEPTKTASSDYHQARQHAANFPRLQGKGASTKNQEARAWRALRRRRAGTNQSSPA